MECFQTSSYLENHYTYDNRNRLLERSNPQNVTCYQYDSQGNTVSELTKRYLKPETTKVQNGGTITNSSELGKKRYTYNGEQYDQISQQYYLRAIYYNPLAGRFIQEDVYHGDGLNLYTYCGNNPVMYVDPSGYAKKCETGSEGDSKSNNDNFEDKNWKQGKIGRNILKIFMEKKC